MKKKMIGMMMSVMMGAMLLTGCQSGAKGTTQDSNISVVSREDGSGTRSAFVELLGIEEDGVDNTTVEANITNSTAVMLSTVAGNPSAIGYVSLGSLDDSVKAVSVDGAEATAENVDNGNYSVARPFNIAVKDNLSEAGNDFIQFILSTEGQQVVEDNGYIKVSQDVAYESQGLSGKVSISGSSSVTPVMEKLKEAYTVLNPQVTIEIQESDSSTGMSDVAEGISDIGMASRALKDSEIENGLQATEIAKDGIAVVVNKENETSNLTAAQIKDIFTGEITTWAEIEG